MDPKLGEVCKYYAIMQFREANFSTTGEKSRNSPLLRMLDESYLVDFRFARIIIKLLKKTTI